MALFRRTMYDLAGPGIPIADPRVSEALAIREATRPVLAPPSPSGQLRDALDRVRFRESDEGRQINAALRREEIAAQDRRAQMTRDTQMARFASERADKLREAVQRAALREAEWSWKGDERRYQRERDLAADQRREEQAEYERKRNERLDGLREREFERRGQLSPKDSAEVLERGDTSIQELREAVAENPAFPVHETLLDMVRKAGRYGSDQEKKQAEEALLAAQKIDAGRQLAAAARAQGDAGRGMVVANPLRVVKGILKEAWEGRNWDRDRLMAERGLGDVRGAVGIPSEELAFLRGRGQTPGLERLSPDAIRRLLETRRALAAARAGDARNQLEPSPILDRLGQLLAQIEAQEALAGR